MVVLNTNDAGPGSLRQAILDANAALDAAVIRFEIPATDPGFLDVDAALAGGDGAPDVFRIAPLTVLPTIINPAGVTIDGRSQTQFGGDANPLGPEIVLDGSLLAAETDGLTFHSSNNVVTGLNLHSFPRDAVVLTVGGSNVLQGNYIGIDPTGRLARRNRLGVYIVGSPDNLIGGTGPGEGNLISGNLLQAIQIRDAGSTGNLVQGNRIGTNALGTAAVGNQDGIGIYYGASDNLVGGATEAARNVISGNSANGVILAGTTALGFPLRNHIEGNFIGTNAAGTAGISSSQTGVNVILGSHDTVIRGTDAARQIISGNSPGINVFLSDGVVIEGNYIGTDITGMFAVKNSYGVIIQDSNQARIGGGTAQTRNVISGNSAQGISIQNVQGPTTTGNVVRGNYIGTNAAGTGRIANGQNGISISGSGNTIGGPLAGQGNVISGNMEIGIRVGGANNLIQGNHIGVDATGITGLGNGREGVLISGSGTIVGAPLSQTGGGNIIAFNGSTGAFPGVAVVVFNGVPIPVGNAIRGNSIHDNTGLGIDLSTASSADGVTPNDPGDLDSGANGLINFPVISAVDPSAVQVSGTMTGVAGATYTLDFYAGPDSDPSGHGEGRRYLGAAIVVLDGAGSLAFNVTLPDAVLNAGDWVTATATREGEGTSEFSVAVAGLDTTAPRVTSLYIGGIGWTSAFYNHLASAQIGGVYGYVIPTGTAAQLDALPWFASRIAVRFSEYVDVRKTDLSLAGVVTPDYAALLAVATFVFDAATLTAQWTFPASLPADKLRIVLDDRVTDTSGNALDGEWIDGASTQSGNGSAGGDLSVRINLLPGDVDRDGTVAAADLALVRAAQFKAPGAAGYNPAYDLDGSASILINDAVALRNLQGIVLPAGEPTAATAPSSSPASSTGVAPLVVRPPAQPLPLHLAIPNASRRAVMTTQVVQSSILPQRPQAVASAWLPLVPIFRFAVTGLPFASRH